WRAQGAFLVSAARANGQTAWVRVSSLAGEPCRLRADFSGPPRLDAAEGVAITALGVNRYTIELAKGETALLIDPAWEGDPVVAPVTGSMPDAPVFGLKR
uniref:hypothetical protein n=1 Tax=Desulfobacter sp. UBA2225 TaxID=1961413 RepID=UPI00257E6E28